MGKICKVVYVNKIMRSSRIELRKLVYSVKEEFMKGLSDHKVNSWSAVEVMESMYRKFLFLKIRVGNKVL